uniref:Shaw1 n=2 Tax=Nematostella vectensis TaxID=45351 RepID=A0A0C5GSM9_NEMVE|nr:Shaw1 [Nematostella vectensis]
MDEINKVMSHEETIQEEESENDEDDEEGERSAHIRDDSGNSSDREGDHALPPLQNNEVSSPPPQMAKYKDRVSINVGGVRHETYKSTLKNIPDTRLSWIAEASAGAADFDPSTGEYFFDRHPGVFANVLNYYRTGKLHCPLDVCGPLFEDELGFWGIDDQQVESCCWLTYRQHRDAQETLAAFEGVEFENEYEDDEEPDLGRYGFNFAAESEPDKTWWERYQPRIWTLMEEPHSSTLAKVIAYTTLTLILVSVGIFCLESMEKFSEKYLKDLLVILEGICVVWFTLELMVRFVFCPAKCEFFKKIMNWIDFLAIVPFYVSLGFNNNNNDIDALMIIRLIRIFRIFKLSRHSSGLQILGHTLRASFRELLLLIFFLLIGVVLFASLIFYCEKKIPGTKFVDIPSSFWWAVVTMTTVGYGDMAPQSPSGKFIGSLCAVCGVLTIALPVPVIVNNFSLYYSHAQARLKLPKKRRRVLVGAPNALKATAMLENGMSGDSNGSADSGCAENSTSMRKCSLMITDEVGETRPRRPIRRESHLFNNQPSPPTNGDAVMGRNSITGGYAMQKRRSMRPTVPTLPEVE